MVFNNYFISKLYENFYIFYYMFQFFMIIYKVKNVFNIYTKKIFNILKKSYLYERIVVM